MKRSYGAKFIDCPHCGEENLTMGKHDEWCAWCQGDIYEKLEQSKSGKPRECDGAQTPEDHGDLERLTPPQED